MLPLLAATLFAPQDLIELGARKELFVDRHLIESVDGVELVLHPPRDEGEVLRFDAPWEGGFSGYVTAIQDGGEVRLYYRGRPLGSTDNGPLEVTCVALSEDGLTFEKPALGLYRVSGTLGNNVVLADAEPVTHNFTPLLDERPGVPPDERYKGLGGSERSGLVAYVSADGLEWRKLQDEPVITDGKFDSQNVAFWSAHEGRYVCYFRTWSGGGWTGYRTVSRATSDDFRTWSATAPMTFGDAPPEHLYTNQTRPYPGAPHLYVAIAARFFPGRRVLTDEQARRVGVDAKYSGDCSDAVLMTSRGGEVYDRTFLEGFVRPGIGLSNWVSRTNYPACGLVRTGPEELSLYVQHDYAQDSAHVRRYSLRLDGLASARAGYDGGELVTRPVTFDGARLVVNFATSAAGEARFELRATDGEPLPGFSYADHAPLIGNEVAREVRWSGDLAALAGRTVRLAVRLKDADLFSVRFAPAEEGR